MTETLKKQLKEVAKIFKGYGATEVYVFGSAATGTMREHSDIDLAVSGLRPEKFFRAMSEAADILNRPVDLVDLERDDPIAEYLKRKGKLHRVA